jgi:2-polyprenyl-3-methyl-5-hydroxy-6-metoxy-1,4-benzoquinol methylase
MDEKRLNDFASAVMQDLDATAHCALSYIGDKLGLYKAMANAKDMELTCRELASFTSTDERYVREWLAEQASKSYILYDPLTEKYKLPNEHAAVLADETSSTFLAGGFQLVVSLLKQQNKITRAFRKGDGIEWASHDKSVFEGQARLNGSLYRVNISKKWIPSLAGVEEKLCRPKGARVADVGCGYGVSTTAMAKSYPNSSFIGIDNHNLSIKIARERAKQQGLGNDERLRFITARAETFSKSYGYDLITFFDCFHDMGNPIAVGRHIRNVLKPDGTLMLVEMSSSDKVEENINSPVGTNGYAGSILVCLPTAFAQMKKSKKIGTDSELVDLPLGGMSGAKAIESLVRACGFSKFRCALKDDFNMILEARP